MFDLDSYADWLPSWGLALAIMTASACAALIIHKVAYRGLNRLVQQRGLLARALVQRTKTTARLALVILAAAIAANLTPLPPAAAAPIRQLLLIGFIVVVGSAALAALHVGAVVYSRRFRIDVADNLIARKHLTQVRILERTAAVFIILLTLAAALMTLEPVRQYGVTLLASAGAAGIIAGLALQPLLTNLIAGVQIAVTQPIRIDDAVIVEGEWGWIEEINSTYVVVRLWDWRRMILPLTHFIQKPFQNWTRETASLIGSTFLYVDYDAPIDAMRHALEEIVKASPLWDRDVVNLQVTDATERTLQVRCLMSAKNAGEAFDLRCEVREKMVAFLRESHPEALPQDRFTLTQERRTERTPVGAA